MLDIVRASFLPPQPPSPSRLLYEEPNEEAAAQDPCEGGNAEGAGADRDDPRAEALVRGPTQSLHGGHGAPTNSTHQAQAVDPGGQGAAADILRPRATAGDERHRRVRVVGREEERSQANRGQEVLLPLQVHHLKAVAGGQGVAAGEPGLKESSTDEEGQDAAVSPRPRQCEAPPVAGRGEARSENMLDEPGDGQRGDAAEGASRAEGDADFDDQVRGLDHGRAGEHRVGVDVRSEDCCGAAQADAASLVPHGKRSRISYLRPHACDRGIGCDSCASDRSAAATCPDNRVERLTGQVADLKIQIDGLRRDACDRQQVHEVHVSQVTMALHEADRCLACVGGVSCKTLEREGKQGRSPGCGGYR